MAWEPPPERLVARFDALLPASPLVARRRMFGCPCAFVNGNMFAGVYQSSVIVRLPAQMRASLLDAGRAQPFSVRGRTMREYALVAEADGPSDDELRGLLNAALAFAQALPPKPPKSAKRTASASVPRRRKAVPG